MVLSVISFPPNLGSQNVLKYRAFFLHGTGVLAPPNEKEITRAGSVASSLKLHRQGAVGFIDWLDVSCNKRMK